MKQLNELLEAATWKPLAIPWNENFPKLTHYAVIELRGQQIVVWKLNDGRVLAEVEDVAKVLEDQR